MSNISIEYVIEEAFRQNVSQLNLRWQGITIIPSSIGKLKSLERLNLSNNEIARLPKEIGELTHLQVLSLGGNQLKKLPESFDQLRNLIHLDLSYNHFELLPKEIGGLKNLKTLNLYDNAITVLPAEISNLTSLDYLNLLGNKLNIPLEIITNVNKPQSILNSYFGNLNTEKSEQRQQLHEAKLIVVGQGSVGKTSLLHKMINGKFNTQEPKTDGIAISYWSVEDKQKIADSQSNNIQVNVWDFGGQEIMHATHQFFLTKRSLYLLVLDARLTQEENRVEYWLKIIESYGEGSPVLIVGNKIDQHPLDIDKIGLHKKYSNIVGFLETSALEDIGISQLKAAIRHHINNLPHIRDLLPKSWFSVKAKLESLAVQENYISHSAYHLMCNEHDIKDESSQLTLISFMHDLGVVLHFYEDPRLEALGILNPKWVTNGVYRILNSHELFQNQGRLTLPIFNRILDFPEYPKDKRLFILDMMKKFELSYDIETDKSFLVPDLLPKDEPQLNFHGVPVFEYIYPVLPPSIITRFIVRMNQKIDDNFIWRTGVVLKIGRNSALVKGDIEDRKITIAIDGAEYTRRDALSAIRYQLDEIHETIKGLNPQKRVPIPEAPDAEPLDYEYLLQLENEDIEELPVKDGNRLVKINVKNLLSGVVSEYERKQFANNITNIFVGRDLSGSIAIGDDITITNTKTMFKYIYRTIEESPREGTEKANLTSQVQEIENEAAKGEEANEIFMTTRLRNLKNTAPDIADVILAALTGPAAAVGTIVKKVAKKIKDDTK